MKPLYLGIIALALLAGAYCFGRRDAPSRNDQATASLLAGIQGYKRYTDSLARALAQEEKGKAIALATAKGWERRADSLKRTRVPLPHIVPASCQGWALNLSTCDQEQAALRKSLGATREALDATARLQVMSEHGRGKANSRVDSLTTALRKARHGDFILGVKLPSRGTTLLAGGVLGFVAGLVVSK